MIRQEEVYRIGVIGKPHGVKGEVNFNFDDDVFDRVDAGYLVLRIDGILVPFFIEEYRFKGQSVAIMKFEDIDSQERARDITGCEVFFPRSLSDDDDDTLRWDDIIGYTLYNNAREKIGTVSEIDDSTENVLLTIKSEDGREILIPAAGEFVTSIDNDSREMTVELPEGLLDI